jgi:transcriptional regulator with XRE-family HTH domain
MDTLAFGSFVRELRRSGGLGLRVAAAELGIDPSYLSRIENDEVPPPSRLVLSKMAEVYRVPISDLIAHMPAQRTDSSSLDPVAAALYRIALSAPAAERIRMLQSAIDELNLPPDKKEWWLQELARLRTQVEFGQISDLLREEKGINDLFGQHAVPRRLSAAVIEQMALSRLKNFLGTDLECYNPPTPVEEIIEAGPAIDLAVFGPEVGGKLADGSPRVLGRCRWKIDGRIEIGIDERLFTALPHSPARRRGNFTLAHEYFHAVEHLPRSRGLVGTSLNRPQSIEVNLGGAKPRKTLLTNEDWREYQANTFAAAILMPAPSVRREFSRRFGDDNVVVVGSEVRTTSQELSQRAMGISGVYQLSLSDLFDVNPLSMAIRLEMLGLVKSSNGDKSAPERGYC